MSNSFDLLVYINNRNKELNKKDNLRCVYRIVKQSDIYYIEISDKIKVKIVNYNSILDFLLIKCNKYDAYRTISNLSVLKSCTLLGTYYLDYNTWTRIYTCILLNKRQSRSLEKFSILKVSNIDMFLSKFILKGSSVNVYIKNEPFWLVCVDNDLYLLSDLVLKVDDETKFTLRMLNILKIYITNLDISAVTTMKEWFWGNINLTEVYVDNFNTGCVTSFENLFFGCKKLVKVNLENWNTGNVRDMSFMFYNCASLVYLNLNNWDVRKVNTFSRMFDSCISLEFISLDKWKPNSSQDFSWIFEGCNSLLYRN